MIHGALHAYSGLAVRVGKEKPRRVCVLDADEPSQTLTTCQSFITASARGSNWFLDTGRTHCAASSFASCCRTSLFPVNISAVSEGC